MPKRKYIGLLFPVLTTFEVHEFEPNVCIQMTCIRSEVFIVANAESLRRHMPPRKYLGLLLHSHYFRGAQVRANVCIPNGL